MAFKKITKKLDIEKAYETRLLDQYVDYGLLVTIAKASSSKATGQVSDLVDHIIKATNHIIATFPTHSKRKDCVILAEHKLLHMWDLRNDERTAVFFTPTSSKNCLTVDYQLFWACSSKPISNEGYDPNVIASCGEPCGEGIPLYPPDQNFSFAWANENLTIQ